MKVLFIGDIVGRPGRKAVKELLPGLRNRHQIDMVVANGENAAGGFGITREVASELFGMGIDIITMGNHTWDKKEAVDLLAVDKRILRPYNYPSGNPGVGIGIAQCAKGSLGVILLNGRVYMDSVDCPFRAADAALAELKGKCSSVIVDFHAEATSEKIALGWYLDGRVAGVFGTHTHVQTADGRLLHNGTAYVTDVGMTGPYDSVLGVDKNIIIRRFLHHLPESFEVAKGEIHMCGVILEIGYDGLARSVNVIDEAIS